MPSGRVHFVAEAGVLAGCSVAGAALVAREHLAPTTLAAFSAGFAFAMLFLSPDLDLARSRPTRRWGALAFLWWPYAKLFRHRGISHHVFWGPLTRLAYLALLVVAAAAVVSAATGLRITPRDAPPEAWAALGGVYVPNVLHVLIDASWPHRAKRRRA